MNTQTSTTWNEVANEYGMFLHEKYIHFPALISLFEKEELKGKSILDIGSGTGVSSKIIFDLGCKVRGIEISEPMLQIAKEKYPQIDFMIGDSRNLPVESSSADGVLMATLLSNFSSREDIEQTLREAYRCIKEGGKLVITIPHPCFEDKSYPNSRERIFGKPYNYLNEGQLYVLRLYKEEGEVVSVSNYHWPLSVYINSLAKAGFNLKALVEPKPIIPLDEESRFPVYLMIVAQK